MEFQKSYLFYNKVALFNNNENEIFNVEVIIFINYVNINFYQLFKPCNEFVELKIIEIKIEKKSKEDIKK